MGEDIEDERLGVRIVVDVLVGNQAPVVVLERCVDRALLASQEAASIWDDLLVVPGIWVKEPGPGVSSPRLSLLKKLEPACCSQE